MRDSVYAFVDWAFSHPDEFYPRMLILAGFMFLLAHGVIKFSASDRQEGDPEQPTPEQPEILVPGTTDEPVAPEYEEARWGKGK